MTDTKRDKGFGSYRMGVSADIKPPPFMGLDQGINWGAPVVEMEGEMNRVGKTGLEAIKHLAKANNVKVSWHIPENEQYDLASPDIEKAKNAVKMHEISIDNAKEAGVELINTHATYSLPRFPDDTLILYDKTSGNFNRLNVPKNFKSKEEFLKFKNREGVEQIKEQLLWTDHYQMGEKDVVKMGNELVKGVCMNNKEAFKIALREDPFIAIKYNNMAESMKVNTGLDASSITKDFDKNKENIANHLMRTYDEVKSRYEHAKDWVEHYDDKRNILLKQNEIALREGMFSDGQEVIHNNLVKNMAKVAKKSIDSNIAFCIENGDSRYMYSDPQEMNRLLTDLKGELKKQGVSDSKINKYVGFTFDTGHANTMKSLQMSGSNGEKITIGDPSEYLKKMKHKVKHVHYHENFGDVDAHLPLGEAFPEKERKKMQEFLEKEGFKGHIISESVVEGTTGKGFYYNMLTTDMGSAYGTSTDMVWGPTYISSNPTTGLFVPGDTKEHYFYGSFMGGLF